MHQNKKTEGNCIPKGTEQVRKIKDKKSFNSQSSQHLSLMSIWIFNWQLLLPKAGEPKTTLKGDRVGEGEKKNKGI